MTTLLILPVIIYLLIAACMFAAQRRLLYLPDTQIDRPERYGLEGFSDINLSEGGPHLQLWYRKAAPGFPTVAYFHGNASNVSGRAGLFAHLAEKGFGLAAVSYRGYGRSAGAPTEQGLYEDARAALHYLEKEGVPASRIILFGESLGTGVAVQMATEHSAAGLILQAPYTSVTARAGELYRFLPVRILLRDRYESLSKIGRIKSPLLLYHGERDETIPVHHGRALLDAAPEPKRGVFFPDSAHNDFDSALISSHVLDFAQGHGLIEHA